MNIAKKEEHYPLLLTGTIDSSVYSNVGNKITNVAVRLSQYENAIRRYISDTKFDNIVFIDNSGYPFDCQKFVDLAQEYGKSFEFIPGEVHVDKILRYGKSFGDAYLIHEGLEKSKLLKKFDYFYKATGRIFLLNSDKILRTCYKHKNEFVIYKYNGWCLTNFFKAKKNDYLQVLDNVYEECDEKAVRDIEIAFFRRLERANIQIDTFSAYPFFDGVQGATLRSYSAGLAERTVRNICARLQVFTMDSPFNFIIAVVSKIKGIKSYKD